VTAEGVELYVPEAAVVRDPAGGAGERRAPEPAVVGPAPALAGEQAGALEDAQVLGDRRQRDAERRRELGHGGLARRETRQHRPPRGIGERAEGRVERARRRAHHACPRTSVRLAACHILNPPVNY
jgi:hypothetical protein